MASPPSQPGGSGLSPATVASKLKTAALYAFLALLAICLALYFVVMPLIGLATGELFLVGRGSSSGWIEGPWARIISAAILLVPLYFIYWCRKSQKKRRLSDELPIWQKE